MRKFYTAVAVLLGLAGSAAAQVESIQRSVGTNAIFGNNTRVPTQVLNIAALRAAQVTGAVAGQKVAVTGYYAIGDGGGGDYQWSASSTTADNNGTIIAPTGVSTGRWVRTNTGDYAPEVFGARGDGTTDDTTALQNAAGALPAGGILRLTPGKIYAHSGAITLTTSGVSVIAYGATFLALAQADSQTITFSSVTSGAVLGGTFNGAYSSGGSPGLGIGAVQVNSSQNVAIRDCYFENDIDDDIYVYGTGTSKVSIVNCTFINYFCAIWIDGPGTATQPTKMLIDSDYFDTGRGTTGTAYSGAIKISGNNYGTANDDVKGIVSNCVIQSPGQVGIEMQYFCNGYSITGNTISNAGIGISFSGDDASTATGNTLLYCGYGIEVAGGGGNPSQFISLSGNNVQGLNTSGTKATTIGISIGYANYLTVSGGSVGNCTNANIYAEFDGQGQPSYIDISGVDLEAGNYDLYLKDTYHVIVDSCLFTGDAHSSTGTSAMIFCDSTDYNVSQISIQNSQMVGSVQAACIQMYSPANAIQDVRIAGNNTAGVTASPSGAYQDLVSGSGSVKRVTLINNTGDGQQDFTYSLNVPIYLFTGNVTADERLGVMLVDGTGGAYTVTLPTAVGIAGKVYTVKKVDSSGNAVTVATTSSQTIDGVTTKALSSQYSTLTVESDGANWQIISKI